jgi:hypothetical protein
MEHADHTNYEQEHPSHETEDERIDRIRRRLDTALAHIDEAEERMARNLGRGLDPDRKTR